MKVAELLKKSRTFKQSPQFTEEYELALHSRDACMIKLFLMHQQKLKRIKYQKLSENFFSENGMSLLPDFQFTINWHCDSDFIPFLSKLAPHDKIKVYKSQMYNILRIDFHQPQSQQEVKGTRRPMSLIFRNKYVQLVDHTSKTISCDLYDLLIGDQTAEDDNFDGQAFELANSSSWSSKQSINFEEEKEIGRSIEFIKKKVLVSLQDWERQRQEGQENPQIDSGRSLFIDNISSEKQLSIDITLRIDQHLKQKHLIQTFELLGTIYSEVEKVRNLTQILMNSAPNNFLPSEIKIPVVSALGIKAVIQISDVDYTRFTRDQSRAIFQDFYKGYCHLSFPGMSESIEVADQPSFSHRDRENESFTSQLKTLQTIKPSRIRIQKPKLSMQGLGVKKQSQKITPPHVFITKMQQQIITEGNKRTPRYNISENGQDTNRGSQKLFRTQITSKSPYHLNTQAPGLKFSQQNYVILKNQRVINNSPSLNLIKQQLSTNTAQKVAYHPKKILQTYETSLGVSGSRSLFQANNGACKAYFPQKAEKSGKKVIRKSTPNTRANSYFRGTGSIAPQKCYKPGLVLKPSQIKIID